MTFRRSAASAKVLARLHPPGSEEAGIVLATAKGQTARSLGSMAAQEADHAFMRWVDGQTFLGRREGIVGRLRHLGPPVRFVGRGLAEPTAKGPADFQGHLSRACGWRPVAMEAKTRTDRLSRREIPDHQVDDLEACHAEGGLALLLYEHRDGVVCVQYAIPWAQVPWAVLRQGSAGSVGPEECAPWRVRVSMWVELVERGVVERPALAGETERLRASLSETVDHLRDWQDVARSAESERAALAAIVAGRTLPPTDAEIEAHAKVGGVWLYDYRGRVLSVVEPADVARVEAEGCRTGQIVGSRWWALDASRNPCAWPVTSGEGG